MTNISNQKPFLIERRRPLMLKDYLLDDLSSCSSNGFKSFPRRQCCTTVRFLLDKDLKTKHAKPELPQKQQQQPQHLKRRRHSAETSRKVSALHRASEAVINAVKLLPFSSSPSVNSPSPFFHPSKARLFLPRSFSRRLFKKHRFWKKSGCGSSKGGGDDEIKRWKSFREFLEEPDKPSDQTTVITTTTTTTTTNNNLSTTNIHNISNTNSWEESKFTGVTRNDAGEGEKYLLLLLMQDKKEVNGKICKTDDEDSITHLMENTKVLTVEEKEQFSPVSVLDCPFHDEEEISSPFHRSSLIRLEGTKNRLMHKTRRFENLGRLEPVDLQRRIAMAELDDEPVESALQPCSTMSIHIDKDDRIDETKVENEGEEHHHEELVKLGKATMSNNLSFKADPLLSDFFFGEKAREHNESRATVEGRKEMVQDWLDGDPQVMFMGWEVKDCRHVYIKDMEKNGEWRNLYEEKGEMGLELEFEIFTSLVNELFLDVI